MVEYTSARLPGGNAAGVEEGKDGYYTFEVHAVRGGAGARSATKRRVAAAVAGLCVAAVCIIALTAQPSPSSFAESGQEESLVAWGHSEFASPFTPRSLLTCAQTRTDDGFGGTRVLGMVFMVWPVTCHLRCWACPSHFQHLCSCTCSSANVSFVPGGSLCLSLILFLTCGADSLCCPLA
jgi:hypothetical protein